MLEIDSVWDDFLPASMYFPSTDDRAMGILKEEKMNRANIEVGV